MENKNILNSNTVSHHNKLTEVVNLPYRVYESFKGKYFMGHTPFLILERNLNAWGGLMNPEDSEVKLYINTFTVSNTSNTPFRSELWLNSEPLGRTSISPYVSPANTTIYPLPTSDILLGFAQHVKHSPSSGISLFNRIAEANSTVVGNYYGKIVIPPGGSLIVYLHSPGSQHIKTDVALGWWEEPL
ncbi:DUF6143 family protein [Clostridium coskatii]|uniref:Uncharacterized protein n=1 Tax=Clostridium coskatii TaxID=1705578 RepID=A0A166SX18_9CLOT|nr:DUF6143 family protein [Clostridium coskatii]OAA92887.1 hypothetical protein WX73_00556 [Clostridium coskatii]OBR95829.1 hypothetical protein CLCOS_12620 [Clostridium coskatii]